MSAGMNMEEAKKISEKMTYKEAVMNCLYARCVPYRKATKIKMEQLLKSIDNDFTEDLLNQGYTKGYKQGRADGIEEFADLVEAAMLNGTFGITDVGKMVEQLKESEE